MERISIDDLKEVAKQPERLDWRPLRPGIDVHLIYQRGPDGPAAAFLRYQPGASLPRHRHAGLEHIFVLAGAQQDEHGRYEAGAMVINPPETAHSVSSPGGCIVLALWERPVVFDSPQSY